MAFYPCRVTFIGVARGSYEAAGGLSNCSSSLLVFCRAIEITYKVSTRILGKCSYDKISISNIIISDDSVVFSEKFITPCRRPFGYLLKSTSTPRKHPAIIISNREAKTKHSCAIIFETCNHHLRPVVPSDVRRAITDSAARNRRSKKRILMHFNPINLVTV